MADEAPLTLDSALSLMTVTEDNKPAAVAQDDPPAATPDTTADPIPAAADTAAADPNSPADPESVKTDDVDQGALPLIDPPASWKPEEKALWEATPRAAQEAILRRELDNTTALRKLQNSAAEQHKTTEAEVTRLKALTGQIEGVLNEKVAALSREFPEIKSEADVVALSQTDPARFSVFQAKLMELSSTAQQRQAALTEVGKVDEAKQTEYLAKAKDALLEAFPEWKDPQVARTQVTELQDYAIKTGAPEAAARASLDPVIYKLAQKAMLYDRAQAAKTAAVTRDPPRVVKPGTQTVTPASTAKEENRRSMLGKLSTSGDLEDARGLLRL